CGQCRQPAAPVGRRGGLPDVGVPPREHDAAAQERSPRRVSAIRTETARTGPLCTHSMCGGSGAVWVGPGIEPCARTIAPLPWPVAPRHEEAPWRSRGPPRRGGSDRRRSGDLSIFSRTLYQLSYRALFDCRPFRLPPTVTVDERTRALLEKKSPVLRDPDGTRTRDLRRD